MQQLRNVILNVLSKWKYKLAVEFMVFFSFFFRADWLKYVQPYTVIAQLKVHPEMSLCFFICYIGISFVNHSILKVQWTDFDVILQFNDTTEIKECSFICEVSHFNCSPRVMLITFPLLVAWSFSHLFLFVWRALLLCIYSPQ